MSAIRALLLAASQNKWLRERASRYSFVRKSVSRFMPGETLDDALRAARELELRKIGTVLTHLGENVIDLNEAEQVTAHDLELLEKIKAEKLQTEISVKLTQLGLDLSPDVCEQNLRRLLAAENSDRTLWLDMEASGYVDATLRIFRKLAADFPNTGICLQAYLHRTEADIDSLLPLAPSIRLVKGAYSEPANIAMQGREDIVKNYLHLAQKLLRAQHQRTARRVALATHDPQLIHGITDFPPPAGLPNNPLKLQILYDM